MQGSGNGGGIPPPDGPRARCRLVGRKASSTARIH
jgi:hypothetical protein